MEDGESDYTDAVSTKETLESYRGILYCDKQHNCEPVSLDARLLSYFISTINQLP